MAKQSLPRDRLMLSLQTSSLSWSWHSHLLRACHAPSPLPLLYFFGFCFSWRLVKRGQRERESNTIPGKEIEDNPGFHARDKLILERRRERREGKCDVQAAFNQSRVSGSLNNGGLQSGGSLQIGTLVQKTSDSVTLVNTTGMTVFPIKAL